MGGLLVEMLHAVRLATFFVIIFRKRNQADHTPKGAQGRD